MKTYMVFGWKRKPSGGIEDFITDVSDFQDAVHILGHEIFEKRVFTGHIYNIRKKKIVYYV